MSDDVDKKKIAKALAEMFLRHNAAHFTLGVLKYARDAAGSRTMPELLREIAKKGTATAEERAFLHQLLLAIAEGRDVRAELRIDAPKIGHNPPQRALNADIVSELSRRVADGQAITVAFDDVAAITGKTPGAVRKIWQRHGQ